MRASIGLGLIALVGLFACAADDETTYTAANEPAPAGDNTNDNPNTNPVGGPTAAPPPAPPVDPTDPEAPPAPILPGLAVTNIAVFQAVKVPVVVSGKPVATATRKAPVVAKRPGVIRVYVAPASSFAPRDVTAELRLVNGDKKFPIIRETKRISGASTDEDLNSTFNLEVPGESLPPGITFQVSLTAPDGDATAATASTEIEGRYPRDGSFGDLGAELAGKLKVVLVPVKYDADGSGRLPDLDANQVELHKKVMMKLYPTSEVSVTVHDPFPFKESIGANGGGFSSILKAITQLRAQDKPANDVYYYGLFNPKENWKAYCAGGCVTGLSPIVDDPRAAGMRASVGIGFVGQESAETLAHEVGHAHGRMHSPCGGVRGPDPRYPHQGGAIGAWGYDIFTKTLIPPTKGKDIMGYCSNKWVSDYTYNAFFERMTLVSLEKNMTPPNTSTAPNKAASYRIATLGMSGELAWDGDLDLEQELEGGAIHKADFVAESGATMFSREARFFAFDHLPGGFLLVPKDVAVDAPVWKTMNVEGFANALTR
jgi:hypothetical protein